MSDVLVGQNGCVGEGENSQWNVSQKCLFLPRPRPALVAEGGSELRMVASSTVGPGTQALLVAGRVARV